MKYFPLIWAGIWRRRGRTALTFLSIANAFLLLGLLNSFTSGLSNVAGEERADSLVTRSKLNMLEPLPTALADQIRTVPAVRSATPVILFPTSYQNQFQGPIGLGVDPERYFAVYPEISVSSSAVAAMRKTRTGVIVGQQLMKQYGWKIGDRQQLTSNLWFNQDGSNIWPIDIVGTYRSTDGRVDDNTLILNYDYIDESRLVAKGTANWFAVRVGSVASAAAISAEIDRLFDNSSHETKTSTAAQLAEEQITRIGNIGFVVNAVAGAMFFFLLFYIGSGMVQSVRERTSELGTLKALGFSDRAVCSLIVAESLLLCVCAALVGLMIAAALFPLAAKATGLALSTQDVMAKGVLLAIALALISGLPPALRAMRLSTVDALAGK